MSNSTEISDMSEPVTLGEAKGIVEKEKPQKVPALFRDDDRAKLDYLEMSSIFVSKNPVYYDRAGIWWKWDSEKKVWGKTDEVDLLNCLSDCVLLDTVNSVSKAQFLESLRREGRKFNPVEPPKTWVQFKDTIVDVKTGEKIELNPQYFMCNVIPWKLGETTLTPKIDELITSWITKDTDENKQELVEAIKERIAFLLVRDYFLHRAICFVGGGSNGKDTLCNLITKFVGRDNVTSTDLDALAKSRFETAKLYKKLVAFISETKFTTLGNTSTFKKLTGQSLISFEYKFKGQIDDWNYAKLIINSNSLPITFDKTDGFYRRWDIWQFPNRFNGEKDILAEIPNEEYENLARKCVELLKGIYERGKFSYEKNIDDRAKQYEMFSNPISRFIELECELEEFGEIKSTEFKKKLDDFLQEHKCRAMNEWGVAKVMKLEGFSKRKRNTTNEKGEKTTTNFYCGLSWKEGSNTSNTKIRQSLLGNNTDNSKRDIKSSYFHTTRIFFGKCELCGEDRERVYCIVDNQKRLVCEKCAKEQLEIEDLGPV